MSRGNTSVTIICELVLLHDKKPSNEHNRSRSEIEFRRLQIIVNGLLIITVI